MHTITIMSKPGCHLCEAALNTVQKVVGDHIPVLIREVDITQDQELLEKYRDDIPVVLINGKERFRHDVDPQKLGQIFANEMGGNTLGIGMT
jgi:glutaredoxin